MNPRSENRPPAGPNRPTFSCDLHPDEKFNGFCPSCLCDRLTTLHPSSSSATSSLFRRTKSFSSKPTLPSSAFYEPQRRSCDVRVTVVSGEGVAGKGFIRSVEDDSGARGVPIEAGRGRASATNDGVEVRAQTLASIVGEITTENGSIEDDSRGRSVAVEVGKGRISAEKGGVEVRAQTLANNVGEEINKRGFIGSIEEDSRVRVVPIEVGRGRISAKNVGEEIRAQTLANNVGEEINKKGFIGSIEEENEVRVLPIEVGRGRILAKNVGEEIRARTVMNNGGEKIRAKVPTGAIEEESRIMALPIEVGRGRILASNGGEEIRVKVPIEDSVGEFEEQTKIRAANVDAGKARTLAQNVGDRFRGRVSIKEPNSLIEEKCRVRAPIEAGRARTLGHNVGDKIRVFEEQIAPIGGKLRIRAPKEKGMVQSVGEIRPFEEKTRISVPIKESGNRTESHNVGDEIRVLEEQISPIHEQSRVRVPIEGGRDQTLAQKGRDEIKAFVEDIAVDKNMKSMRHYIDLDFDAKKKKPAVGFWSAASVFSKKWSKWMKKQKAKKQNSGMEKSGLPLNKQTPWKYRETQSEVADYGFGRLSCDTDPRFSIDIGRFSVDGPRPSFDPPRASWDGHMMRRNIYSDHRTPLAEPIPGNTLQTHQYYLDTSSRRRRSFDRSGFKNNNLGIGGELDETKLGSNAKVTPETFDFHQRKSNSNSLRDECSEIFELGIRDDGSIIGSVEEKGSKRRKKWSFWGLINRRNKYNEDDRSSIGNSFDKSSSLRGNNRGGTSGDTYRRSSSVSLANSYNMGRLNGNMRNKSVRENGHGRKKKDELILDRNRSVDNGLLRFYLTPPRSKNSVFGSRKSSGTDNSRSISKGLYRY